MIPNVLVCLFVFVFAFVFALLFLLSFQSDKKYSIYILRVRSTKYIHKHTYIAVS